MGCHHYVSMSIKHRACRFDSRLWRAPMWTEVANGYLDLTQWGATTVDRVAVGNAAERN